MCACRHVCTSIIYKYIKNYVNVHLKALSHDIRTIFSTLRACRSYHTPLIEKS